MLSILSIAALIGAQALEAVAALAVVEVAIRREQHLRRDLAEAVEDAVDAEIRRARRPHRTDAAVASMAITVSGRFGMKPATRSPARTPASRSSRGDGARPR
jgi:predicted NBD/HSP70 family sugar kinase